MAETTLIIPLILLVSLLCNVFLALSSFTNTLPNAVHTHTALAIPNQLQKNKNNITSLTPFVKPVNHPPVAHNMNITTIANAPVGFTLNGTDPDEGDILNFTIVAKPVYGNITSFDSSSGGGVYNPFIYPVMGVLEPHPTLSSVGTDAFAFKITDSKGAASNAAIVTIISKSK
jgi:hypothetical protein